MPVMVATWLLTHARLPCWPAWLITSLMRMTHCVATGEQLG